MGVRECFLDSVDVVRPLLAAPEVGARWTEISALEGMSIGALAAHLARAVLTVNRYLAAERADEPVTLDAAGYLAAAAKGTEAAVLARAEQEATAGQDGVLAAWDEAIALVRAALHAESPDATLAVLDGIVMSLDEYLRTRLLELVVHTDDLAVSLGIPTPDFPAAAVDDVVLLLVTVARHRHGDTAVVRAFTRRERDDIAALRVL